jgi:RNA polymerase sigma-70 factor (ECF subfamily)
VTEALLARARAGDDRAFGELVEPYRRELHLHCYRLLGSLTDAEDVLQEVLLAAWRGIGEYERRASLRTWLYRIATNRCLNVRRDQARRRPPVPVPPFRPPEPSTRSEITWLQPYPDPEVRYGVQESVELAFVAGLQKLPPRQAAALVLRDVLGYTTAETAALLETTETAVKGSLQRARASLPATANAASPDERSLAQRFAEAFVAGDIPALLALLTDDAWLAMPPAPHVYRGHAAIKGFLEVSDAWRDQRKPTLVPTRANGQPAFGYYLDAEPAGMFVLTVGKDAIRGVTRFLDNRLFPHFDLPPKA